MKRFMAAWTVMVAVAATSCVADVEEGAGSVDTPDSEAQAIFQFSPSNFKFVITVPDDGTDLAGGAQTARAVLNFPAVRPGLTCSVKVDVAIRSSVDGIISPSRAAKVTADAATVSASVTYHMRKNWPSAAFCEQWREGMRVIFATQHPGFGARVNAW